jgi:hypothetical protein
MEISLTHSKVMSERGLRKGHNTTYHCRVSFFKSFVGTSMCVYAHIFM